MSRFWTSKSLNFLTYINDVKLKPKLHLIFMFWELKRTILYFILYLYTFYWVKCPTLNFEMAWNPYIKLKQINIFWIIGESCPLIICFFFFVHLAMRYSNCELFNWWFLKSSFFYFPQCPIMMRIQGVYLFNVFHCKVVTTNFKQVWFSRS